MLVRTGFIDPKDYPFRHHIEAHKHLDTDEHRHKITSICETIDIHYKNKEYEVCDKEQLGIDGKYRIPKKLQEAKTRGFSSILDMYEADKKAEEDAKVKESVDLKKQVADLTALVQQLLKK